MTEEADRKKASEVSRRNFARRDPRMKAMRALMTDTLRAYKKGSVNLDEVRDVLLTYESEVIVSFLESRGLRSIL